MLTGMLWASAGGMRPTSGYGFRACMNAGASTHADLGVCGVFTHAEDRNLGLVSDGVTGMPPWAGFFGPRRSPPSSRDRGHDLVARILAKSRVRG